MPDLALTPTTLYARRVDAHGNTRHSRECKGCFGRTDFQCPRCLELLQGAAPRGSFLEDYAAKKLGNVQRRFNF